MKFLPTHINTIIFDLGGVILNLSPEKTIESFSKITGMPAEKLLTYSSEPVFTRYEKGEISSEAFRDGLRDLFKVNVTDMVIDESWNAMLLDLPLQRLEMIGRLRPKLNTFVLSNTNEIHIAAFDKIVAEATQGNSIQHYFDKVYYSHKMGMRKPEEEIFKMVLKENNLEATHTLFIDDTLEHIESAKKIGLHTWHLTNQEELFTILGNE